MEAIEKLRTKALTLRQVARGMTVTNEKELRIADEFRKGTIELIKEIRAGYDENIKAARAVHTGLITKRDSYLKPAEEAKAIIGIKMQPYMAKREAKRQELLEKARKEQEEKERLEREAKKKKEKEIEAAIEAEEFEKAEELIIEEPAPTPVKITKVPEKVRLAGTHQRTIWKYRVINLELVPRPLLMLDHVKTNKIVQRDKEKTNVPGIEAYPETKVV